ncbi:MAG: thioesterase family protein [Candidatus Muiribacteriota bacterium]
MSSTKLKIRYSEVDKMGRAYNAHYLVWFEVGRTDFFREREVVYSELENKHNLFLPVREAYCKFKSPVSYDDDIEILTDCKMLDKKRIKFSYKIINLNTEKICALGFTVHVFIESNGKTVLIPEFIIDKFNIGA